MMRIRMKNLEVENGNKELEKFQPLMGSNPEQVEIKDQSNSQRDSSTPNSSHRGRLPRTIWFWVTYVILGMIIGQTGPAFLDLQLIAKVGTDKASAFFTVGSLGAMTGALLGGHLLDRVSVDLMQMGTLGLAGIITIVYPWSRHFPIMVVLSFLNALMLGNFDASGNAVLLAMWGEESGSPMQMLHFCFALGAVFSPLYIRPFLAPRLNVTSLWHNTSCINGSNDTSEQIHCSNFSGPWNDADDNSTIYRSYANDDAAVYGETRIHYAYLITGCITILGAFPFVLFYLRDRTLKKKKQISEAVPRSSDLPRRHLVLTMVLMCLFYFLYNATEDCFFSYLSTVVVKQLSWQKTDGALLTSAFWAAFSSGRFAGVFLGRHLRSVTMLLMFIPMMAISMLGFLLSVHYESFPAIWVATVAIGIAMSVVFPTGLVFMEQDLTVVSGRIMSVILLAASVGTMTNPLLLGALMENYTYMWFSYLLLGETLLLNAVLVSLILYSRLKLQKLRKTVEKDRNLEVFVFSESRGNGAEKEVTEGFLDTSDENKTRCISSGVNTTTSGSSDFSSAKSVSDHGNNSKVLK